jgi:hypothetical protein
MFGKAVDLRTVGRVIKAKVCGSSRTHTIASAMDKRKLGYTFALIAVMLTGCDTARMSPEQLQFQKQSARARECREMQDRLVGEQPLTPDRTEEIAKTMEKAGCTARLPRQ